MKTYIEKSSGLQLEFTKEDLTFRVIDRSEFYNFIAFWGDDWHGGDIMQQDVVSLFDDFIDRHIIWEFMEPIVCNSDIMYIWDIGNDFPHLGHLTSADGIYHPMLSRLYWNESYQVRGILDNFRPYWYMGDIVYPEIFVMKGIYTHRVFMDIEYQDGDLMKSILHHRSWRRSQTRNNHHVRR